MARTVQAARKSPADTLADKKREQRHQEEGERMRLELLAREEEEEEREGEETTENQCETEIPYAKRHGWNECDGAYSRFVEAKASSKSLKKRKLEE